MSDQMLYEKLDTLSEMGALDGIEVPSFIKENLNPRFSLRPYQIEALRRLLFYFEHYRQKELPVHLLYEMATGSGKTLLMAANILYFYEKGYRYFLFFVNSTNIIEKTKNNFLNPASTKYLFAPRIRIYQQDVRIREIQNFQEGNDDDINILFMTIQGLHSKLYAPSENTLTFEDFDDRKIVLLSDEAHHMNALTKNKLSKEEQLEKHTWEYTINEIFTRNKENVMLEYTATAELQHPAVREKYKNKAIYKYSLKEFREDRYSKDVKLLRSDVSTKERVLQALLLSQYRKKVAEKYGIVVKPVILIKSNNIPQSEEVFTHFDYWIKHLSATDIELVKQHSRGTILEKAFHFFEAEDITFEGLAIELQEEFAHEKRLIVNNKNDSEEKQLILNSLEDETNPVRIVFAVNKLNEGWDVLNLFDIVRVDEGRGTKTTTTQEAQLIGRGARYFPFQIEENQEKYKRKYDEHLEHELRVLEELYYHSINDSKYISELQNKLKETGIFEPSTREIKVKLKEEFKNSSFYKTGVVFLNKKKKVNRSSIRSLRDLNLESLTYTVHLKTGLVIETDVFREEEIESGRGDEPFRKYVKMSDIPLRVIRKGLQKEPFYHFSSLKRFFPHLRTINEFATSTDYFGALEAEVIGNREVIEAMEPDTMLQIVMEVGKQLKKDIQANTHEYEGTKTFYAKPLKELLFDKTLQITETPGDREVGEPMSNPKNPLLRLDLSDKNWYVYEENYGTSEEKHFIQMFNTIYEDLKKYYKNIYILRNERLFQIYRFLDGKPLEPDFLLFAQKKDSDEMVQYQLFIEPKGEGYMETDRWKEEFLLSIERLYDVSAQNQNGFVLLDKKEYRIVGMPFYNKKLTEQNFRKQLYEILNIPE